MAINRENDPIIKKTIKDFLLNGFQKKDIIKCLSKSKVVVSQSDYNRCLKEALAEMNARQSILYTKPQNT